MIINNHLHAVRRFVFGKINILPMALLVRDNETSRDGCWVTLNLQSLPRSIFKGFRVKVNFPNDSVLHDGCSPIP